MMSETITVPDHIRHADTYHVMGSGPPRHVADVELDQLWGITGAGHGARIAVLDTGIDSGHPFFADKDVFGAHSTVGESGQDGHGHGTHCASVVLQMAPQASLCSIQVLGTRGGGSDQSVAAGVEMALGMNPKPHALSMSLGGRNDSQTLELVVSKCVKAGVIPFVAAGNDSMGSLSSPARYRGAVAIGAVDYQMRHASFSNTDAQLRLAGAYFGVRVYAAVPVALGSWQEMSGTSMATPGVVGVFANLVSFLLANSREDLIPRTADELARFSAGCTDLGDTGQDPIYGFGFTDPRGIIGLAQKMIAAPASGSPAGDGVELVQTYDGEHDGKRGTFRTYFQPS